MAVRKTETVTSAPVVRGDAARAGESLVSVWPRGFVARIEVGRAPRVIGRGDGPDALGHGTISRAHAEIVRDGSGRITVRDLGSRNGTAVDGAVIGAEPVVAEVLVRLGDVVFVIEPEAEREPAEDVDRSAVFGESYAIVRTRRAVAAVASELAPVLLLGETGVGKEMIAREIHRLSQRKGAFVAVNAAELSPQLLESQLFGHQKGAFTGAVDSAGGLFRAAHGGTLFLDEIGELPTEAQPKLLRAIQEREVRAVGATRTEAVDVRVIAATHVDLPAEVEAGRFRRDLYARLALFEIMVPPLRARRRDVMAWVDRLAERRAQALGRPWDPPQLEVAAVERLILHGWPENLRGVDMLVHRVALSDTGPITPGDLDVLIGRARGAASPGPPSDAAASPRTKPAPPRNRDELKTVLAAHNGSVRAVAQHYGRDRRQVYRWLDAFDLRGAREEE